MGEAAVVIDPFGALDVFCTNAVFEMAAPGIVRVLMTVEEGGATVVKVKLLLPLASLPVCIAGASAFAAHQIVRGFTDDGSGHQARLM